jgi:hypothetical protein
MLPPRTGPSQLCRPCGHHAVGGTIGQLLDIDECVSLTPDATGTGMGIRDVESDVSAHGLAATWRRTHRSSVTVADVAGVLIAATGVASGALLPEGPICAALLPFQGGRLIRPEARVAAGSDVRSTVAMVRRANEPI